MTTEEQNGTEQQQVERKFFYYENEGKVIGPTEEKTFYELIIKNQLPHGTLMWEVGTSEWKKVGEVFKNQSPPILPISQFSNGYVITISIMPFIQMFILRYFEKFFGAEIAAIYNYSQTLIGVMVFICFFISVNIFMILDIRALEKKKIEMGKSILLWGNLVPTYLFYRGTLLARSSGKSWHSSHALAFIWLVSANYAFNWQIF
jgi:hypothetical protein